MKGTTMYIFTLAQYDQLIKNGSLENRGKDHIPVVKLFLPASGCTWLITELDPEQPNYGFGLCDLGLGFPELGSIDMEEILELTIKNVYRVERDLYFTGKFPISVYSRAASTHECIIEDETILVKYVSR